MPIWKPGIKSNHPSTLTTNSGKPNSCTFSGLNASVEFSIILSVGYLLQQDFKRLQSHISNNYNLCNFTIRNHVFSGPHSSLDLVAFNYLNFLHYIWELTTFIVQYQPQATLDNEIKSSGC